MNSNTAGANRTVTFQLVIARKDGRVLMDRDLASAMYPPSPEQLAAGETIERAVQRSLSRRMKVRGFVTRPLRVVDDGATLHFALLVLFPRKHVATLRGIAVRWEPSRAWGADVKAQMTSAIRKAKRNPRTLGVFATMRQKQDVG